MSDATGFTSAPERYTAHGRETIDRIRDELGDAGFRAFCIGNAMKYEDRAGRKGDPEGDAEKARWYRQMAAHLDGEAEDPRSGREGFVPYSRPMALRWNCWNCRHDYGPNERGHHGCHKFGSEVDEWIDLTDLDEVSMPSRDADGCPGCALKTTT